MPEKKNLVPFPRSAKKRKQLLRQAERPQITPPDPSALFCGLAARREHHSVRRGQLYHALPVVPASDFPYSDPAPSAEQRPRRCHRIPVRLNQYGQTGRLGARGTGVTKPCTFYSSVTSPQQEVSLSYASPCSKPTIIIS